MSSGSEDEGNYAVSQVALKRNTLDGALLATARAKFLHVLNPDDAIGMITALVLHFVGMALQIIILVMFRSISISEAEGHVTSDQLLIRTNRMNFLLPEHKAYPMRFNVTDEMTSLCINQTSHPFVHYAMLIVWFAVIMPRVFDSFYRFYLLLRIDNEDEGEFKEKEISEEGFGIGAMDVPWKFFCILVIVLPHLLVNVYAAWIGAKFMCLQGDIGGCLLKAMVLQFMGTMDVTVYSIFAAPGFQTYLDNSSIDVQIDQTRGIKRQGCWHWLSCPMKVGCAVVVAFVYYGMMFDDLRTYRAMCVEYTQDFRGTMNCIGDTVNTCGLDWNRPFTS